MIGDGHALRLLLPGDQGARRPVQHRVEPVAEDEPHHDPGDRPARGRGQMVVVGLATSATSPAAATRPNCASPTSPIPAILPDSNSVGRSRDRSTSINTARLLLDHADQEETAVEADRQQQQHESDDRHVEPPRALLHHGLEAPRRDRDRPKSSPAGRASDRSSPIARCCSIACTAEVTTARQLLVDLRLPHERPAAHEQDVDVARTQRGLPGGLVAELAGAQRKPDLRSRGQHDARELRRAIAHDADGPLRSRPRPGSPGRR